MPPRARTTKPGRRGRPPKSIPKLNADADAIARAVFSAVRSPDPKRRIRKRTAKNG